MTDLTQLLISLDRELFLAMNVGLANPIFDAAMPVITNSWVLRGTFAAIILALPLFGKRRGAIAAIGCIVAVILSDQISAQLLKPVVERIRPCHVISSVHLLVDCSQGLSFPSSHAANTFGQAVFLGVVYPWLRWYLVLFATLVSYSRIAVGVHYPFDVMGGGLVGIASGVITLLLWQYVAGKILRTESRR